ncbi:alpha/beta hydrolase [Chlorogloeopsis sp. ULAP01]|uniref:alpha/beta hydrolase n=1 Tax=Chlorogloeopsis sp. ULAP01 TaxID=3056483 RepID=UPI0025AB1422|nr:alpha/beta hydrolase [Chlorogloeopsis sp. ULAP01]MDM9385184.1 alpha/beta hydrolase [Chlorogloeopsis sp. ULAP01]
MFVPIGCYLSILFIISQNRNSQVMKFMLQGRKVSAVKKLLRILQKQRIAQAVLVAVVVINAIACIGAYTLTHFSSPGEFSLGIPRPENFTIPTDIGLKYVKQRISINQTEWLETWFVPAKQSSPNGTILLFPGNGSSKGKQLLAPTKVFHALNYDSLLVDFRGVGGSSGNTTTLGIREAKDVALVVNYAERLNLKHPIVLYGVSMGSAAILKALAQEKIEPDAIILELPFARLLNAVKSRLRAVNIPSFLTAELLVFWGSIQQGFNGFAHNPVTYANQVKCPTLVFQGKQDQWTNMTEINELFQNLRATKQLVIFPNAKHQLLVTVNKEYWQQSVEKFFKGV